MKEFKKNFIISYGRLKFWKSQKNPNFGTFCVGSFWKCDIEKVIFPEFYRASFGFLIKKFFNFFSFSKNLVFETWKKTYYPIWPFRPFCHELPKQSGWYVSIYIYLYYRYVRSEIQKWCTCRYLGTISVRTYRYFHLIHFCDVQQFS